jgi:type III restriction enzyme
VIEWRKAYTEYEKMGKKTILFVMTDDTGVVAEPADIL